jgi:hypothetical protein
MEVCRYRCVLIAECYVVIVYSQLCTVDNVLVMLMFISLMNFDAEATTGWRI